MCCSVLQCVAVRVAVHVAVHVAVLVAVLVPVLVAVRVASHTSKRLRAAQRPQYVAVRCSMLQCVLKSVVECCGVLQCAAACCSACCREGVLQYVAVHVASRTYRQLRAVQGPERTPPTNTELVDTHSLPPLH